MSHTKARSRAIRKGLTRKRGGRGEEHFDTELTPSSRYRHGYHGEPRGFRHHVCPRLQDRMNRILWIDLSADSASLRLVFGSIHAKARRREEGNPESTHGETRRTRRDSLDRINWIQGIGFLRGLGVSAVQKAAADPMQREGLKTNLAASGVLRTLGQSCNVERF
jgi:hypothetical protein